MWYTLTRDVPLTMYFFVIPCMIQVILNFLEFKRLGEPRKLFGMLGFVFITLGIVFSIALSRLHPDIDRALAVDLYRLFLLLGCVLWMIDQAFYLKRNIRIAKRKE